MFELIYRTSNIVSKFNGSSIESIAHFMRQKPIGYFQRWQLFNTAPYNGENFHSTMQYDFCVAHRDYLSAEKYENGYRWDEWTQNFLRKCEKNLPLTYVTNYHRHERKDFLKIYGKIYTFDDFWPTNNTDIDQYWHYWSDDLVLIRLEDDCNIYGKITGGLPNELVA